MSIESLERAELEPHSPRIEAHIDNRTLEGARPGQEPLRQKYDHLYGKEGWEAVPHTEHTVTDRFARIVGLLPVDVMVTPEGDEHAKHLTD